MVPVAAHMWKCGRLQVYDRPIRLLPQFKWRVFRTPPQVRHVPALLGLIPVPPRAPRAHLVCLSHTTVVRDVLPEGAEPVHLHKKDWMEASWPGAPLVPWGQGRVQLQSHHSAGDMLTFWLFASSQEKLPYW